MTWQGSIERLAPARDRKSIGACTRIHPHRIPTADELRALLLARFHVVRHRELSRQQPFRHRENLIGFKILFDQREG